MKDGDYLYCHTDLPLPIVKGDCFKKGIWYQININPDQFIYIAFPPLSELDEGGMIMTITEAKWKLPLQTIKDHFYTKQELRKAKILQLNESRG